MTTTFRRLAFIFVFFVAKLFSSRHKGTKTLRTNKKVKNPGPKDQALVIPRGDLLY